MSKSKINAAKQLDKVFREHGATRRREPGFNEGGVTVYTFPDGAQKVVSGHIGWHIASQWMAWAQQRYALGRPALNARVAHTPPVIDPDKVTVTAHARERMDLMRNQARMTPQEVRDALWRPEQTMWSGVHGAWLWVRGRVAVAAHVIDGHTTIRTVLWTDDELWAAHPRPERHVSR